MDQLSSEKNTQFNALW